MANGTSGKELKNKKPKGQDEQLEALRERLYSRGNPPSRKPRKKLSPKKKKEEKAGTRKAWKESPQRASKKARGITPNVDLKEIEKERLQTERSHAYQPSASSSIPQQPMPSRASKRKQYRTRLFTAGLVFFVAALVLSSIFLIFGENTISGSNISIDVDGPFVVGGGEEMTLQIAIANQNAVPVESATLIIEYPDGTQSAQEPGKELFRDRKALNVIESGEILSVPASAFVFGEENEEKEVKVSVEYRVAGSNATFFKEAEPLRFKISSSPVVVSVDAVKEITSGQEAEIDIIVTSNSPTTLSDILVEAEYPFGFDYSTATPEPIGGQNVWNIDILEPGEERVITIRGVVIGKQDEDRFFTFTVGVANERDAFSLSSIFSAATLEVLITEAFIALDVSINNSSESVVSASRDESVRTDITFQNTLPNTIYDVEIQTKLDGNALDEDAVDVSRGGFYDSIENTISWNWNDLSNLEEMAPGEVRSVSFTVEALSGESRTPQLSFTTSVSGKRVSEDRVPESLTNSVERIVRFESVTNLSTYGVYSVGPFVNTGPIQPVAEELSQYTVIMTAQNGSNDVTDVSVTAELPAYVTWLDLVTGGDTVVYDVTDREITWEIGDLEAKEADQVAFQISVVPSISQVGSLPTILGEQRLKATDRFTGTVLRDTSSALTTRLFQDPNEAAHDGEVLPIGGGDDD